ncbi:MAG: DedA family protein [Rhodospirillales bacterium]|nr:DedA family protein [Rhodospirillales bacterium]
MGLDPLTLIKSLGYAGVWSFLFLESGVPFFFFLPGDSLLFTAGFLASQGFLSVWILMLGGLAAAVAGNLAGYEIGRRIGMKLFAKGDTRFLKRKHLEMTERFYAKHGKMTIIMARFMPIVRTFAPFCAGMVRMNYREFIVNTLIGALLWVAGLCALGYKVGEYIPPEQIDHYLLPIIIGIIILSFVPSVVHVLRERRAMKREKAAEQEEDASESRNRGQNRDAA